MGKKRKTKKEKLIASSRHDFSTVLTITPGQEIKHQIKINAHANLIQDIQPKRPYVSHSYTYVAKDVRNTLFIIAALVTLNLIIFFLLKSKIVSLGLSF